MASKVAAPTRNPQVEQMLAAREFTWDYVVGVPLDQFDEEGSVHNQARVGKPVDPGTVDRYATCITNGDVFPAIICADRPRRNLLIVDGNHRFQAFKAKSKKAIDAYVIRGASPSAITMLTFEVNTKHGLPSSIEDRIHQALYLMDAGAPADEAAKRLGLKVNQLRSAANLAEATRRATDLGISPDRWDRLVQAVKLRLGQVSMDDSFAAMTQLVLDAHLSTNEANAAVNEISKLRTSSKQLEYIAELRSAFAERIQNGNNRDNPGIGRQMRSPRMILGMALGQMAALPKPESIAERMTPEDKLSYMHKVDTAIKQLTDIRDVLKQ